MKEDVRSYNVGASDYATHKFQIWDLWIEYKLNSFDGDLLKRTLRHKTTDPREMDYKKIIHICKERIRQIEENGKDWWEYPNINPKYSIHDIWNEYNLNEIDGNIVQNILFPNTDRISDYNRIIYLCEEVLNAKS